MDNIVSNIDGVTLTPLKIIKGEKGDVMHALKVDEKSFKSFGEAYFSTVNYQQIKGWKKHHQMTLNIIVPFGKIKFVIFDDRLNSKTHNCFYEVILSPQNYFRLTVEPGLWMAFKGMEQNINLLLNIASIPHNPSEAENLALESFNYLNW